MANTLTLDASTGGVPKRPTFTYTLDFSFDTYAAGGILLDALLAVDPGFIATKLAATDIVSGYANLDTAAGSQDFDARFLKGTRAIALIVSSTGAEQAAGAIGATATGEITLILA